jgi:diguanylate cyclase (GGDEF)-like protein
MTTVSNLPLENNILLVDDKPENLSILSAILQEEGYEVRGVISGTMALTVANAAPPMLILLDIMMPEMDGYEVCKRLKANPQTAHIPVIFISALDDVFDKVRAFRSGGVDYISKPFQHEEVIARVQVHLKLFKVQEEVRQLNTELELRVKQRTVQLEQEILERQQAQQQLLYLALHDVLTGLPNRTWLMERLTQLLKRSQQHPDYEFAVLFLDCDRFKFVNDSLGHSIGDQLLVAVARRLEGALRPAHLLARLGGDEFVVLVETVQNQTDAIQIAARVNSELKSAFKIGEYELFINASTGIVIGNSTYTQPEHLLRDADTAMYEAKARGKGRYAFFQPDMHLSMRSLFQIETELRRAVEQKHFLVYYQPIVELETLKISGFEALVRWRNQKGELVSPATFITIAEETELILPIDLWVLRNACIQLAQWQVEFPHLANLTLSVNLSAKHFLPEYQPQLLNTLDQVLAQTGLQGHQLKLEITESAIIDYPDAATECLHQLRARHIKVSIDDFGTGYSSLSYLHKFPVSTLKIDRAFVIQIGKVARNTNILDTIITLAQQMNLTLIAEGVETLEQLQYLQALKCEESQGYLFSPPVDAQKARELLIQPIFSPDIPPA